jgi:hypothetical protein
MIFQLNPSLPVYITENPDSFPSGKGRIVFIIDYSIEEHVLFGVAYDKDGSIWWIPTMYCRLQVNSSAGRLVDAK